MFTQSVWYWLALRNKNPVHIVASIDFSGASKRPTIDERRNSRYRWCRDIFWMNETKGLRITVSLEVGIQMLPTLPPPPKKNVQVIYRGDGVKKTLNNVTPIPRETDRFMFQLNEQTKLFFQLCGSFPLLFLYV